MTVKLYELTAMYKQLLDFGEETGADVEPALETLTDDLTAKVENVVRAIRMLDAEADAFQVEAERLKVLGQARHNRVQGLRKYLQQCLEAAGLDALQAGIEKVWLQDSSPGCELLDAGLLPDDWKHIVTQVVVDKKGIIGHWKATGEQVPGAVVSQGRHLRIR